MRRLFAALAAVIVLPLAVHPASAAGTSFRIPGGYHGTGWERMGDGLDRVAFRREGAASAQAIQVARLRPDSPFALRAVVSDQAVRGGLETTSSMCRRVRCAVAVNGDFFSASQPVGGLTMFGQAIRSPLQSRPQLLIGGNNEVSIGNEAWVGQVVLSNFRGITIDGVNVPLRGGKISLFTAAWGKSTGNRRGVTELGVRIVQPKGPLVLGQEATIHFLTTRHTGDAPIPADGFVLAGEGAGAAALDGVWSALHQRQITWDASIVIRSTKDASVSVGGAPVLLRDGRRAFTIVPRGLVQGRHPRTIVGWNKRREIFLVAVDGRQPGYSEGMTLIETANLLLEMGATDAINLDGGGSTTFVSKGRVVNHPSDVVVAHAGRRSIQKTAGSGDRVISHTERAVATAIVIVPLAKRPVAPSARRIVSAIRPANGARFLPAADDPAVGTLLIAAMPPSTSPRERIALVAFAMLMGVASLVVPTLRRSPRRRR